MQLSNIVVAPFGLFKKKEKEELASTADQSVAATLPSVESLTIQEAQALLQQIESANLQALALRLGPVKASAERSLRAIGDLASDMEREKIKLEGLEQRFKSLVENSRKTIVSTLKREAATTIELPQSVNDLKKFREKFESLLNRFGEVTGSHSKILNNFMKKQSSKMKEEFEVLRELLVQSKTVISEFEQKRDPIVRCHGLLNTALQKVSSLQSTTASAESTQCDISTMEEGLAKLHAELASLESSSEFRQAQSLAERLENAEAQREELRNKLFEHFSHLSRAFTKYSYGVSKETEARLGLMLSEPWKLLDMQDTSAYTSLLLEVRKSVSSGKIQLKDSDKMIGYIDSITQSLPDYQIKARQLDGDLDSLRNQDMSAFNRVQELKQKINEATDRLTREKDNLEFLRRQSQEKKHELDALLSESSELLASIAGRKYSIRF